MKIESDKKPDNDRQFTIADVKAFFAKLELLGVADTTRIKGQTTLRGYVTKLEVDTDDVRSAQVGEPGHEKWPGGLR